ncbi:GvpL/GvpF family gas vesicle protein [bacterium]|nr:GvpL/GvpF family gas vesicle protein [bacterium]
MSYENKYLFCIIEEPSYQTFGSMRIGNREGEVHTLSFKDLGCVMSSTSLSEPKINRKNLIAHQKVIEKVINDYTVLPIRFGTIASSAEEVRNLLMKRYHEFKNMLRAMDNKVEMGLKVFWIDINSILTEIANSDRKLKELKEKLIKKKNFSLNEKIDFGEKVKEALDKKREKEVQEIIQPLRNQNIDYVMNSIVSDSMVMNSAFLIDKRQEPDFDDRVAGLSDKYKDRYQFKYIGPSPPYNFVNLYIRWGGMKEERN